MSPERGIHGTSILEESARIRDELLPIEAAAAADAHATRSKLLEGARLRLGYGEPDAGPTGGLVDTRISEKRPVITPESLSEVLPPSEISVATTLKSRNDIAEILTHQDDRMIVIVGPCSIHDPEAALEYAEQVKNWREQYGDDLEIVMRAYMEKPRSELDWKGFIYDPELDGSDDINLGVVATHLVACQITDMGVPIAMERLNALTPQYVNGLVAYDAIGARNTTDQKAREYGSGTSSPVGFKNTPEGSIVAAAQAVVTANGAHAFLGMGMNGMPNQIETTGNELAHVILRGDQNGPNYSEKHIAETTALLKKKGLLNAIVIDASHGNSLKVADNQIEVIADVSRQVALGEQAIRGVMIESNLVAGSQNLKKTPKEELIYGQSVTDECVGLPDTITMLSALADAVRKRRLVTS
ncbi:MAG: aroG [Candidatus Saccharibacteria bacterium]|nr:aroG [Candidatus Saccharibacteria bacterium]